MTERHDYDVLIAGGGLVGASLACALEHSPLRVALLEAVPADDPGQPSFDDRSSALAPTARKIFEALDVWPELRGHYTPIREIHVSDRGRFGFARIRAEQEGVEALGYVVGNRQLGEVLTARAAAAANCDYICPGQVMQVRQQAEAVEVALRQSGATRLLRTRLLVVADGMHSRTRDQVGIAIDSRDYGQVAIIANLTPERAHNGRAFERFTADGAMAVLPAEGGRCGLIWTVPAHRAEAVLALDEPAFLQRVQELFGYRLGRLLRAGRRCGYPLMNMNARHYTAERALVLGNAAHTLHPVAGQGLNLALRDVAALAELLHQAALEGADPGRSALLQRYETDRRRDYAAVAGFTDGLLRLFGNALPGLAAGRNLGLLGFDLLPLIKPHFVRQAMGYTARLPRLARGLPLASAGDAQ